MITNLNSLTQVGTQNDWESIGVGRENSLAIKYNKTLWISGYNLYGMLGDGTTIQKNVFTQVGTATNWKFAFTGEYHTIGINMDDSMLAWGQNFYGELGNGSTTTSLVPITITCPALNNEEYQILNSFQIYPNPVTTILNINSNENEIEEISVIDLMGKVMLKQKNNFNQINVQNLASGIYFLSVTSSGKTTIQKFIKE
ncbi:T9SS type A sorting domain-containing protein [Flavobacterium aciduliphilum]|uniref:Putative secreted protein (Por secretion system target) n=1 Tax=Flavobacterium aciduliphilum TaxID=1101402 RepID=A0A328YSB6_9FLAO|nr:T9SS type A sorting domain-containing protein [Flavobacterium aciduliphilum]RAR75655.1 putative secreted protein (Por secretion system target) [Flavobacterium aciduliphilum]